MRKIGLIVSLVALFALPVTASALSQSDFKNASKFCKALKAEMNTTLSPTLFQDTYGTNHNKRNAHGKCVSKFAKVQHQNHTNAAKECKAAENNQATSSDRPANPGDHNSFGQCVSQKAHDLSDQQLDAVVDAAKQCRTERGTTPASRDAFRDNYGTNKNKRNAFGKCVSRHVRGEI